MFILATFRILSFCTLPFILQKKIRIEFSANYPLITFRNPHSAKYPFLYDIQRWRNARNQHHFGVVIVLSAASLLLGNYKCKFLADMEENTNKLHLYSTCTRKISIIINIIKSSS